MAVIEDCWFQAMQDEIHEFDRLEVWELVPRPSMLWLSRFMWIYKVEAVNIEYDHLQMVSKPAFLNGDLKEKSLSVSLRILKTRQSHVHLSSEEGSLWA
ncbi:hypothetical protein Tco_0674434 [Tanacetum coccineum]